MSNLDNAAPFESFTNFISLALAGNCLHTCLGVSHILKKEEEVKISKTLYKTKCVLPQPHLGLSQTETPPQCFCRISPLSGRCEES